MNKTKKYVLLKYVSEILSLKLIPVHFINQLKAYISCTPCILTFLVVQLFKKSQTALNTMYKHALSFSGYSGSELWT